MDETTLFVFLAVGLFTGWLASNVRKVGAFGLLLNIMVGVAGAVSGKYLFDHIGISAGGLLGLIFAATVGAAILLFIVSFINRA